MGLSLQASVGVTAFSPDDDDDDYDDDSDDDVVNDDDLGHETYSLNALCLVSGGKDGVIKLWNITMHCVKAFNMREARPPPRHPR
mgnify:CR=1 FL=1